MSAQEKMVVEKARFFEYHQNNSGGSFDPPYLTIIIEAPDAATADAIAQVKFGVYFDGCESGTDCPCCGDRWSAAWGEGDERPEIYGKPIEEYDNSRDHNWGLKNVVAYLDGRVVEYTDDSKANGERVS